MAVLTRDETSEPIKDTRTRAQRLRDKAAAKTEPHDRAEYEIGDRLQSRINPEVIWIVQSVGPHALTIEIPDGARHRVSLPIVRARFINLDKANQDAGERPTSAELAQFEHTDLGQALKDAEAPPELPIDVPEQPVEAQVGAQRVIQITCGVTRKLSRNYNSTEYHCGATVEITDGSDPETVADQTYDMLRQIIRDQFTKGQNTNGSTPKG